MIVDSMTDSEIQLELAKDYNSCNNRIGKSQNDYRRAIIKSNKFPVHFKPIEYVSPRNNKYLLFIEAKTKKDAYNFFTIIVAYFNKPEGIYAVMIRAKYAQNSIIIYPPHFFARYRERYLKQDIDTLDVIKEYFKHNPMIIFNGQKENVFQGACKHGLVFGKIISPLVQIAKTFISEEMLLGDQPEDYEEFAGILSNYNDLKKNIHFDERALLSTKI